MRQAIAALWLVVGSRHLIHQLISAVDVVASREAHQFGDRSANGNMRTSGCDPVVAAQRGRRT